MALPEVPRVIYDKNPLDEVICQVRFPTILKIDAESPAAFQDLIRSHYPLYEAKLASRKLPSNMPEDLAKVFGSFLSPIANPKAHEFSSADKNWVVTLTAEFLALTCRRYEKWEEFKEHLMGPLTALCGTYVPTFFSRLGLRYRDVIRRSELGLENAKWSELLNPWIAGIQMRDEVTTSIQAQRGDFTMALPGENARVRVQHAIADAKSDQKQEQLYLIDTDFFIEQQTETDHAITKLDFLNRQSRNLFRWCITDKLHSAMGPRSIVST